MYRKKIVCVLIIILSALTQSCYYFGNKSESKKVFNELIGTFTIDTSRTYFGLNSEYNNLQITFKRDSTFYFNMKVPFIYDSVGKWLPTKGGLEDWNWLFYKSNPNISTQFSDVWTADSIFYLNSTTPQKGETPVSVIYFKKNKKQ